ncbi:hypothetical protein ACHAWF_013474 [Thalassiosira exigua]
MPRRSESYARLSSPASPSPCSLEGSRVPLFGARAQQKQQQQQQQRNPLVFGAVGLSAQLPPPPPPHPRPRRHRRSSPSPGAQRRVTASGGGAFNGLLRRTKRRPFSRNGRVKRGGRAALDVGVGEGGVGLEDDDYGLSENSLAEDAPRAVAPGRSPFATNGRSPFAGSRKSLEPAPTFYFSPNNSWAEPPDARPFGTSPHGSNASTDNMKHAVSSLEYVLRQVVICCAAFIAGAAMPGAAPAAYHTLELALAAWGTCLLIVTLGWWQGRQEQKQMRIIGARNSAPTEQRSHDMADLAQSLSGTPMTSNLSRTIRAARQTNQQGIFAGLSPIETESPAAQVELSKKRRHEEPIVSVKHDIAEPPSLKAKRKMTRQLSEQRQKQRQQRIQQQQQRQQQLERRQHPHLENLYVMVGNGERIFPNGAPSTIDNDLFHGKMLLMFRTPEADETSSITDPVAQYFRGKQRRFEFQWQFQLKKPPPGDVFLGAELDEPIKMGMIQRALAGTALKFVKKMNQGFTYHLSDAPGDDGGGDTTSYLSFPVGTSMDRFHEARPGETPPALGGEIPEDPESARRRKRGTPIEWITRRTYTMALWSAYMDWVDWQILNFPGVRPFSVTSVAGVQPIKLTLYVSPPSADDSGSKENEVPQKDVVFAMEVSNSVKSTLGTEAKKWNTAVAEGMLPRPEDTEEVVAEELTDDDLGALEPSEAESIDGMCEDGEDMEEQMGPLYEDTGDIEDLEEDDEGTETVDDTMDVDDASSYLLSGSSISLREDRGNYVASGGGYAVLQSSPTSSIVLEKFHPKKKKKGASPHSVMIRNGDVVRIKVVEATSKAAVRYLTIYRGWWLRWNNTRPKRNGLFYVRTGEPTGSLVVLGRPFSLVSQRWSHYLIGACVEGSAKYGGRMLGIYKMGKDSAEDRGIEGEEEDGPAQVNEFDDKDFPAEKSKDKRMMPLLLCAEAYHCVDRDLSSPVKSPSRVTKLVRELSVEDDLAVPTIGASGPGNEVGLSQRTQKRYEIDVPVWLEVMNRTSRTKQLCYAVRVKETVMTQNNNELILDDSDGEQCARCRWEQNGNQIRMFVKLRTGRDVAPLLRLLSVEYEPDLSPPSDQWQQQFDFSNQDELSDAGSSSSSSEDSDSDEEIDDEPSSFLIAGPNHSGEVETLLSDPGDGDAGRDGDSTQNGIPPAFAETNVPGGEKTVCSGKATKRPSKTKRDSSTDSEKVEDIFRHESTISTFDSKQRSSYELGNSHPDSAGPFDTDLFGPDQPLSTDAKKKSKAKHAAVIGRVAKTVKSSTVVTGKHVIKHSKNLGKGTVKGTVSAGRAAGRVIPASVVYNRRPNKHEPGGRVSRSKRSDKGQMKMVGRAIKTVEGSFSTALLSGQLLAPDQSCSKVSQILHEASNNPNNSSPVLDAIAMLATTSSAQDLVFLRGSSAELGVKPLKPVDAKCDAECVVARCIYDGRWCEELCVLYSKGSHIAFYAPLAKKPSLVVSFEEIISCRKCEGIESPLPGFKMLAIDTAWKCHYLAFLDNAGRDYFLKRLNESMFYTNNEGQRDSSGKAAQEYESFRMSLEDSLTAVGKWREVSISKKGKQKKPRQILNARRMTFDLVSITDKEIASKGDCQNKVSEYAENLLRMALSFSPDAFDATDSSFIDFLDETSRLRTLPLDDIDLSSREAFCIFVNLYHCLLQHSLLLAVDGLPNKRSVTHFKRCSSYEIGGDVFSLAELECCVIRGKTNRPTNVKPPFVDIAKKSRPYRAMYSLGATDHRVNFILNNGDLAYPPAVPVLQPQTMDVQMDASASCFLKSRVKIDKRKKTVFLPKVCDVYRNDFGMGDGLVCLSQCLIYLDESEQLAIATLLEAGVVSVKFRRNREDFHPNLTELR